MPSIWRQIMALFFRRPDWFEVRLEALRARKPSSNWNWFTSLHKRKFLQKVIVNFCFVAKIFRPQFKTEVCFHWKQLVFVLGSNGGKPIKSYLVIERLKTWEFLVVASDELLNRYRILQTNTRPVNSTGRVFFFRAADHSLAFIPRSKESMIATFPCGDGLSRTQFR